MNQLEVLAGQIGNTPLYELGSESIPNGNRIFAKEEWKNPTGSHYDRTYLRLFGSLEQDGTIERGKTRLLESTAGTAGISFGWFCSELGYDGTVVAPADLPPRKVEAMVDHGLTLVKSPAGEYTHGASQVVREMLAEDAADSSENDRLYCMNHSQDWRAVQAMEQVGREAKQQSPVEFDYFLAACGNGSTLIGIGRELKRGTGQTLVISCDPAEVPMSYARRYPEVCAPSLPPAKHDVYGTGHWGLALPFLDEPHFSEVVHDALTVGAEERHRALRLLHDSESKNVGHSSALTLAAALRICQSVRDKTFLIIFYDSYSFYEPEARDVATGLASESV